MKEIWIHDTASGKRQLVKANDGHVGVYSCGPTVYNRIHIGNARSFVTYSLLKRFLLSQGYRVTHVSNVTDVNDKIYAAAKEQGRPSGELAAEMTQTYFSDTDALGLGRPDREPLVTESIDQIVELIQALIDRDVAYAADGDVYFSVAADSGYGGLSHRDPEQFDQGEADDQSSLKRSPQDFALWKAAKDGEDTAWDAPWGSGRPGWHIECSAMAEQELGLGFQIHGGGSDLVFPHHENEAAQTRCGRGQELAQIWMHAGMLQLAGEKMSKSRGNIMLLSEAIEQIGRDSLLLLMVSAHYRQPLAFSDESVAQAHAGVKRIGEVARRLSVAGEADNGSELTVAAQTHRDRFFDALADDFNTAGAIAELWEWIRLTNRAQDEGTTAGTLSQLSEMLTIFGLENLAAHEERREYPAEIRDLIDARQRARETKDWTQSDVLRDELAELGWQVRDEAGGQTVTRVES